MGPTPEDERDAAADLFKEAERLSTSLKELARAPGSVTQALRMPGEVPRAVETSFGAVASAITLCCARFGSAMGIVAERLDETLTLVAEPLATWRETGVWAEPPFPDLGAVRVDPPGPEAQVGPAVHIGGAPASIRAELLQFIEMAAQDTKNLAERTTQNFSSIMASFLERFPDADPLEPGAGPTGWLGRLLRSVYQRGESVSREFQIQIEAVMSTVSAAGEEYARTGAWRLGTSTMRPPVPEEEKQEIRAILETLPTIMEGIAEPLVEFSASPREGLGQNYFSLDETDRKSTVRLAQAAAQTVLWRHLARHEDLCLAAAQTARREIPLLAEAIERMLETGVWESPPLPEHRFDPPEAELVPERPTPPRPAPGRKKKTRKQSPQKIPVNDPEPSFPQSIRYLAINKQAAEAFSGTLVRMCEDLHDDYTSSFARLGPQDPGLLRFQEWLTSFLTGLLAGALALRRIVEADIDAVEGSVLRYEATRVRAVKKKEGGQALWRPPALTGPEIDHLEARVLLEIDFESINTTHSLRGTLSGFDPSHTSPDVRSAQPFIEHIVAVFDAWMSTYQSNHDAVRTAIIGVHTADELAMPTLLTTTQLAPPPLLDVEKLRAECSNPSHALRHLCQFLEEQTARLVRFPDMLAAIEHLEPTTASSQAVSDLRAHTYTDLKHLLTNLQTQTLGQTRTWLAQDGSQ